MIENSAILAEIIRKYGSQKACADALGMSESAFSISLKRKSKKFLLKLSTVGIVLEENKPTVIKESVVTYQANKIMELEERVKELEGELTSLRCSTSKDIIYSKTKRNN